MKTLTTLILLLFASPALATDWSDVVKKVDRSIVYIESESGSCTGLVIDQKKHLVLTAAHCDSEHGTPLWVDLTLSRVVAKDTKKDLLVLEVKDLDPTRPALKMAAKNPAIGEEVMNIGFGMGLDRPFFRQAHVQDDQTNIPELNGPFISLDSAFVGGQSGGPVVNKDGEVVLLVQRASNTVGIGVGVDTIKERVGRFFPKE